MDKIIAYEGMYRTKNVDAIRQRSKDYSRRNRGKVLARASERYARKKLAVPGWYGEFDNLVFQEAHDLRQMRNEQTGILWHVDHMIPMQAISVCGLHVWNNIQLIPAIMNMKKKNNMLFTEPGEWLKA